jgi:hypothetical protein
VKTRILAVAALALLWASVANAGVLRFTAKHVVKPVVSRTGHVAKKVVKAAYKVAI